MSVLIPSVAALLLASAGFPSVMGVDGRLHHPLRDSKRGPTVFVFISHDCPVCNAYAPEIGRLESEYGTRVSLNLVYCDLSLSAKEAKSHAMQYSIGNATLLMDPKCQIAGFCKATVTPQAVVFDEQAHKVYSGRIDDRYLSLGQQRRFPTAHDLAKALDAVLVHNIPKAAAGPPVGCFIVFPSSS